MSDVVVESLLDEILQRSPINGTRIVGIDGPSGSGKSTLARQLAAVGPASVVQIDDFISWNDLSGWWPRFDQQVLTPLLNGEDARYQVRDWENDWHGDALGEWKTTRWNPLVLIEGVTCTRRAASGRLAYSIFVDAPPMLRLERGLARDGQQHRDLWLRWMREEADFFADDQTAERADLRLITDAGRFVAS